MSWIEDAMRALVGMVESPTTPSTVQKEELPVEPPPERPAKTVLPFYPSERHIKYNQAPEKSLTTDTVESIAKARRLAEETGVLTPELGEHLLPIAMTEGWGAGMGIKGDNAFYASRRLKDSLAKMGLEDGTDYTTSYVKGEPHISPIPTDDNGPRLAAVILGEKSKLKGIKTVEDAVKRYNGKGKAMEEYYGATVPADVNVYWKKVSESKRLLDHPINAPLRKHFSSVYGK